MAGVIAIARGGHLLERARKYDEQPEHHQQQQHDYGHHQQRRGEEEEGGEEGGTVEMMGGTGPLTFTGEGGEGSSRGMGHSVSFRGQRQQQQGQEDQEEGEEGGGTALGGGSSVRAPPGGGSMRGGQHHAAGGGGGSGSGHHTPPHHRTYRTPVAAIPPMPGNALHRLCWHVAYGKYEPVFSSVMILWIATAGLVVGLQTYPSLAQSPVLQLLDVVVLCFFALEVLLKVMAEGRTPYR